MNFSKDISEFLLLLFQNKVQYLIVGGEAVIYYGYSRFTGDIDIFYGSKENNLMRLFTALNQFWDNDIPGMNDISPLEKKGTVIQYGLPPNRIVLLNDIDGVEFYDIWDNKQIVEYEFKGTSFNINYIGLDDLIRNKKASGRNIDLVDLGYLEDSEG
jgi:hypothetical protein